MQQTIVVFSLPISLKADDRKFVFVVIVLGIGTPVSIDYHVHSHLHTTSVGLHQAHWAENARKEDAASQNMTTDNS